MNSVEQLKDNLRTVREELKNLKKSKKSLQSKIQYIQAKYDDAYESYKNAQEISLYTNRVEADNKRSSINSESSKCLRENQYKVNSNKKSGFNRETNQNATLDSKKNINFHPKSTRIDYNTIN